MRPCQGGGGRRERKKRREGGKPDILTHTCYPSIWRVKAGGTRVHCCLGLHREFEDSLSREGMGRGRTTGTEGEGKEGGREMQCDLNGLCSFT